MERRYEGFPATGGLYVLDTATGEVSFVAHGDASAKPFIPADGHEAAAAALVSSRVRSPFEQEVVSTYPYPVARPFHDLLLEEDPRMRCKLMVDTFTAALKFMALQLASEYLRAPSVKDVQVHQTLVRDLSRPLISAWNLLIARCLPVLRDHRIPLFAPELEIAYHRLESQCRDPFLVSRTYTDEHGELRTRTKKLGKITAFIHYRNGLAHGFTKNQARANDDFTAYYPLLLSILEEMRYMARYALWHVEPGHDGKDGIRLMGTEPSRQRLGMERPGPDHDPSPLFLVNEAHGDILPLYAFFDLEDGVGAGMPGLGKDLFVFEGSTRNTLLYLSANGDQLEKSSRYQVWRSLLAEKRLQVEWAHGSTPGPVEFHAIGRHISAPSIAALVSAGKYLREATVPRNDLNELLDAFSKGPCNGFVLGGESGIGKSTLLAERTETWQAEGHLVALYRSSSLNHGDLAGRFLRDCALQLNYLEDFLSLAGPVLSKAGRKCYLVIDALNEYAGDLNELVRSVENMVAQAAGHPWFKLVVSIRDSAYSRITARFGERVPDGYFQVPMEREGETSSTNVVRLKPLGLELVEGLFNAYRDHRWKDPGEEDEEGLHRSRPLTEFSALDPHGTTVQLMRSPLMARLIMQAFHRQHLPSNLKNNEAMRLYRDHVVLETTPAGTAHPERRKLMGLLVRELDRLGAERLDHDALLRDDVFRAYLMNSQKDSAYIQLLDLGVVMEEWEGEARYIRFAFDRFLEFLLAELHGDRVQGAHDVMKLCERAGTMRILQGAIEAILLRACSRGRGDMLVDLADLADRNPSTASAARTLVKEMLAHILETLAQEDHERFMEVLDLFPRNPTMTAQVMLRDLLHQLFTTGQHAAFSHTMAVARQLADMLPDMGVRSDLMMQAASLHMLQGQYDMARDIVTAARKEKEALGDAHGLCRALRMEGTLHWRQGASIPAGELFAQALHLAEEHDLLEHKAALLSNLGVLHRQQGRSGEASTFMRASLAIRNELGHKKGISASLMNLGILHKDLHEPRQAEDLYLSALEIDRSIGDKSGIAVTLNNLGILYRSLGEQHKAGELYAASLDIKKNLGNKKGISASLMSMGLLHRSMGRMQEAEALFLEAGDILRQLGDRKGTSACHVNLGLVRQHQGRYEEAGEMFLGSLAAARHLGDRKGCCDALLNLGMLCEAQGRNEEALQWYTEAIVPFQELGDRHGLHAALHNLGSFLHALGRMDEHAALHRDHPALEWSQGARSGIIAGLDTLAETCRNQGSVEEDWVS